MGCTMVDATHANVTVARQSDVKPDIVAGYGTGSPDVRWVPPDWALWPGIPHVVIDQGFAGSPLPTATVRDVESGAWAPRNAVRLDGWHAERPTVYCSRDSLAEVISRGWRGDVWLAWPGYTFKSAPVFHGVNVVAVQYTETRVYDLSTVYDTTWPYPAKKEGEMLSMQVPGNGDVFIPFPAGSFRGVHVYRDFLTAEATAEVRIAIHSAAKGYTVHMVSLTRPAPYVAVFAEPDVDAVSIENRLPGYQVGVTLA